LNPIIWPWMWLHFHLQPCFHLCYTVLSLKQAWKSCCESYW
jgi:hypothetical protein